jgi:D-aminopeptidase
MTAGGAAARALSTSFLDPFYTAVVQAVEEAVANALTANEEMVGRAGHRTPALPRDRVAALFRSPGDTS